MLTTMVTSGDNKRDMIVTTMATNGGNGNKYCCNGDNDGDDNGDNGDNYGDKW